MKKLSLRLVSMLAIFVLIRNSPERSLVKHKRLFNSIVTLSVKSLFLLYVPSSHSRIPSVVSILSFIHIFFLQRTIAITQCVVRLSQDLIVQENLKQGRQSMNLQ
jgi:hypothetical protein